MNQVLTWLLAAGVSTGAVVLTEEQLREVFSSGQATIRVIHETNRKQTLEAATVMWQVQHQTTETPTARQLVDEGFLKHEFLEATNSETTD